MKKIYCFISNTFSDMQSERDFVKRIIMTTINQEIMKYGISVECIDLKWGIDSGKLTLKERCHKIITSCYGEIEKSRPYFLSFIDMVQN